MKNGTATADGVARTYDGDDQQRHACADGFPAASPAQAVSSATALDISRLHQRRHLTAASPAPVQVSLGSPGPHRASMAAFAGTFTGATASCCCRATAPSSPMAIACHSPASPRLRAACLKSAISTFPRQRRRRRHGRYLGTLRMRHGAGRRHERRHGRARRLHRHADVAATTPRRTTPRWRSKSPSTASQLKVAGSALALASTTIRAPTRRNGAWSPCAPGRAAPPAIAFSTGVGLGACASPSLACRSLLTLASASLADPVVVAPTNTSVYTAVARARRSSSVRRRYAHAALLDRRIGPPLPPLGRHFGWVVATGNHTRWMAPAAPSIQPLWLPGRARQARGR